MKDHTEVSGPNVVSVSDNSSRSGSSDLPLAIRTPHLYKLLMKCFWRQGACPEAACLFLDLQVNHVASSCQSVRLSVHMEQLGSHLTDFHEI